jgi:8-oxo-dGTP diphosphatase
MIEFFLKKKGLRVRVAGLVQDQKGKILLVQQNKKGKSYWLLPGGGIEFGESAGEALKREFKEELDLEIAESEFFLLNESIDPKKLRHLVQLVFLVKIKEKTPVLNPKEPAISGFGYFSKEEIKKLDLRPDIIELIQKPKLKSVSYYQSKWVD